MTTRSKPKLYLGRKKETLSTEALLIHIHKATMSPSAQSSQQVILVFLTLIVSHQRTTDFKIGAHPHTHKLHSIIISSILAPAKDLDELLALVTKNLNNLLTFLSRDPGIETQIVHTEPDSSDIHGDREASEQCLPTSTSGMNIIEYSEISVRECRQSSMDSVSPSWNMMLKILRSISQFWQGGDGRKAPGLQMVSEKWNRRGICLHHLTLRVVIQSSNSSHILSICQHGVRQTKDIDVNPLRHIISLFPVDILILTQCQMISVLCSYDLNNCASHIPHELEESPRRDISPKIKPQSLSEFAQTLPDNNSKKSPLVSKLFNLDTYNLPLYETDHDDDQTNVNTSILDPLVREILFSVMVLMTVIYRYLRKTSVVEKTKNDENAVHLRILTKSFFIKWTWHQKHDHLSTEEAVKHKTEPQSHPWTWRKKSQNDILNSYIFRPWLRKAMSGQYEPCSSGGCSSTSSLCSACRYHIENFMANPYQTLQVSPAFLPDPTRDPRQNLAHVGYRLATLAALPPSMEMSRIRLADAGFYSRGQGDEVMCYSCRARHSGWTRGDNPMTIHRELSPSCQHVLQTDRELSGTTTAQSMSTTSQGTIHNDHASDQDHLHETQVGTMNSSAEETHPFNSPVEDSEGTPSTTESTNQTFRNEPETQEQNRRSNAMNGHSTSSDLVRTGSEDAGGVNPHSRPRQENHNGSAATAGNTRNASGSEERRSPISSAFPNDTPRNNNNNNNSSSRMVAVHPTDGSNRGPNQASARANSRPLFPTPRLDLGGAVYPMYQTLASRRRTFPRWDESRAPPLDDVVLSGMFYAGYADCVRCFYCGVGLKHWVVTDSVWDEHVRWRPECGYLRAIKGDHFINETQRRLGTGSSPTPNNRPPPPPERRNNPSLPEDGRQQPPPQSTPPRNGSTTTTNGTATAATTIARSSATGPQPSSSPSAAAAGGGGAVASSGNSASLTSGQSGDGRSRGLGDGVSTDGDRRGVLAQLQQEHQQLSRQLQCSACRRGRVNTILMPCGHLVLCESCAESVTSCPLCQSRILATAKVYFDE